MWHTVQTCNYDIPRITSVVINKKCRFQTELHTLYKSPPNNWQICIMCMVQLTVMVSNLDEFFTRDIQIVFQEIFEPFPVFIVVLWKLVRKVTSKGRFQSVRTLEIEETLLEEIEECRWLDSLIFSIKFFLEFQWTSGYILSIYDVFRRYFLEKSFCQFYAKTGIRVTYSVQGRSKFFKKCHSEFP